MKSAIILGASGLTGGYVLDELLKNPEYSKIIVFSRRPLEIENEKLQIFECDLLNLEEQKDYFKADEVYVCIGTTNNKTPNKKLYRDIDFGIPVTAAQLCRETELTILLLCPLLEQVLKVPFFIPKQKEKWRNLFLRWKFQIHIYFDQL